MHEIVSAEQLQAAEILKKNLAIYESSEDLITIGAYKKGSSKEIDQAIRVYPQIQEYLRQGIYEVPSFQESIQLLQTRFGKDVINV